MKAEMLEAVAPAWTEQELHPSFPAWALRGGVALF